MASTIAAVTTSGGGVVTTADASGNLNLLAGTTTVVALTTAGAAVSGTLSASGATTLATTLVVTAASNSLGVVINGRSSDSLGAMYFYANNGTTNYATITTSATEFRHSAVPAASVQTFYTNASERMRIDASGNLLVGTTSVYSNAKLVIDSKTASYPALAAFKTVTGDTANPAIVVSKFDNDGSTSQVLMQFLYNNGSSGLGQINGNGGGSAAFGSYSDIRLKENVVNLPSQLNNIMSLRPVEFDWKDGSGHQIGFIAQEVTEVYPDIVGENADGMLTLTDMNKNDARLIKCIQEQQALILALTDRIAALETK